MTKKTSRAFLSCNCIKSKCTKNYCECFTQGMSQSSLARKCSELCKCTGCENQGESEKKYRSPIEMEETERMCNCKKSNCLKKYCECFNSGVRCTSNCKCQECKNTLEDGMEVEYGKIGLMQRVRRAEKSKKRFVLRNKSIRSTQKQTRLLESSLKSSKSMFLPFLSIGFPDFIIPLLTNW